jgi:hypothetical protein
MYEVNFVLSSIIIIFFSGKFSWLGGKKKACYFCKEFSGRTSRNLLHFQEKYVEFTIFRL